MTRTKLQIGRSHQSSLFDEAIVTHVAPVGASTLGTDERLTPEQRFTMNTPLSHRRRHAQFFTPRDIAELMVEMAQLRAGATVLDPACGPGIFAEALKHLAPAVELTTLDIDSLALACLNESCDRATGVEVIHADFLAWEDGRRFDCVIANPPYLKYQHFDCPESVYDRLFAAMGIEISKFSNLYLLFLLEAYQRLKPGGRAVFIVPGEWTNANFGMPFKQFLAREQCLTRLIYFSHLTEKFEDAMTTASIIELVKPINASAGAKHFLSLYALDGADVRDVREALQSATSSATIKASWFDTEALSAEKKWDYLLRQPFCQSDRTDSWLALGAWCTSRRGIATGANDFFHLRPSQVEASGLRGDNLIPCVGGARHVRGAIFSGDDYEALRQRDQPSLLWAVRHVPSARELAYVAQGEALDLPKRYLLSRRRPWYAMEKANPAPIWIGVFGRGGLRVVRNRSGVAHLTTFHGLTPRSDDPLLCDALVVLLNSSVATRAIERARRVFGAGLEKIEPADVLDIVLPDLTQVSEQARVQLAALLPRLDARIRANGEIGSELHREIDAAVSSFSADFAIEDTHDAIALEA